MKHFINLINVDVDVDLLWLPNLEEIHVIWSDQAQWHSS